MPWKHVWEDNPSDETISVLTELPPRFEERLECGRIKTAYIPAKLLIEDKQNGKPIDARILYHCPYCKGWIDGRPYEYRVDNIGPLCGRRGITSSCIRCGREIGFSGMVS